MKCHLKYFTPESLNPTSPESNFSVFRKPQPQDSFPAWNDPDGKVIISSSCLKAVKQTPCVPVLKIHECFSLVFPLSTGT